MRVSALALIFALAVNVKQARAVDLPPGCKSESSVNINAGTTTVECAECDWERGYTLNASKTCDLTSVPDCSVDTECTSCLWLDETFTNQRCETCRKGNLLSVAPDQAVSADSCQACSEFTIAEPGLVGCSDCGSAWTPNGGATTWDFKLYCQSTGCDGGYVFNSDTQLCEERPAVPDCTEVATGNCATCEYKSATDNTVLCTATGCANGYESNGSGGCRAERTATPSASDCTINNCETCEWKNPTGTVDDVEVLCTTCETTFERSADKTTCDAKRAATPSASDCTINNCETCEWKNPTGTVDDVEVLCTTCETTFERSADKTTCDAKTNTDTNTNTDTKTNTDTNTNTDSDTNTNTNTDTNTNTNNNSGTSTNGDNASASGAVNVVLSAAAAVVCGAAIVAM